MADFGLAMLQGMVDKAVDAKIREIFGEAAPSKAATGKAASPKVKGAPGMIGSPSVVDKWGAFFSDEQIKAGEGYTCRLADPCDRTFKGAAQKRHRH